ncbi:MAG: CLJU_RS11820 family redox protein [Desulfovibrionaceae bacterium]
MSTIRVPEADVSGWKCASCGEELKLVPVSLEYLESRFSVDLPACVRCGRVLVPEALALGKMAEVEKLLEDK